MKNAKRIVALALVLALTVAGSIAGTIAYLKDTDDALNTMTLGDVYIEQWEKDKAGDPFEQDQPLFPMVDNREEGDETVVDGFFNEKMANVIDKVVTVENTGSEDAYVRTIFAFEGTPVLHDTYIGILRTNNPETWVFDYVDATYDEAGNLLDAATVEIDGVVHTLAVATYQKVLPAEGEDITPASLKQFFLAPTAGNEIVDLFDDEYTIYAFSQGVQVAGFTSAEHALNTAFGEITATNNPWFVPAE